MEMKKKKLANRMLPLRCVHCCHLLLQTVVPANIVLGSTICQHPFQSTSQLTFTDYRLTSSSSCKPLLFPQIITLALKCEYLILHLFDFNGVLGVTILYSTTTYNRPIILISIWISSSSSTSFYSTYRVIRGFKFLWTT